MKILVLISTIDRRILRVQDVVKPEEKDVHYVVVWQKTHKFDDVDVTNLTTRNDVTLVILEGKGISRSRNYAMETAKGFLGDSQEDAVFVICDDDEQFQPDAFGQIINFYKQHPEVDIALMRIKSNISRRYFKKYPKRTIDYREHPRSYYPCSVELTFRSRVYDNNLTFDKRFGLGSHKLCAGEEDIFITDALRAGMKIVIAPVDLGYTRPMTTGMLLSDKKVLRSRGAVYGYRMSLLGAFLRSLREAISISVRHHTRFIPVFRNIWYGVKYIRS